MKKTVLITKPRNQAAKIVQLLEQENFNIVVEPIFEVHRDELLMPKSEKKIQAFIVTSGNAADFVFEVIKNQNYSKEIKIFAVGKKTAEIFITAGFKNVFFPANSSAKDLYDLMLNDQDLALKKEKEFLLYFRGDVVTIDFVDKLRKKNYLIEDVLSYKIKELDSFSGDFLRKTKDIKFDFILIYSQNSAKIFFKLAKKHNLLEYFQSSRILCFSENILNLVRSFNFKNSATFDEILILKNFYD